MYRDDKFRDQIRKRKYFQTFPSNDIQYKALSTSTKLPYGLICIQRVV